MSDIPRAWWSPAFPGRIYREYDDGPCRATEYDDPVSDLPPDAVPLVPQAPRDELREALRRAIYDVWQNPPETPCFYPEPMADAVLDVLADRFGLVASPETGEGGANGK